VENIFPCDFTLKYFAFSVLKLNSSSGNIWTFAGLTNKSSTNFTIAILTKRKKADTKYLIDQQRFEV